MDELIFCCAAEGDYAVVRRAADGCNQIVAGSFDRTDGARDRLQRIVLADVGDNIIAVDRRKRKHVAVRVGADDGIVAAPRTDRNVCAGVDDEVRAARACNIHAVVGVVDVLNVVDGEGSRGLIPIEARRVLQGDRVLRRVACDRDNVIVAADRAAGDRTARNCKCIVHIEIDDDIIAVSGSECKHIAEVAAFNGIVAFTGLNGNIGSGVGDIILVGRAVEFNVVVRVDELIGLIDSEQ